MQFYQSEPAYVKFEYNIPRGASIGVYARRNALPTHTQYHFKEVLSGFNARTVRSSSTHVSVIHAWSDRIEVYSNGFIALFSNRQSVERWHAIWILATGSFRYTMTTATSKRSRSKLVWPRTWPKTVRTDVQTTDNVCWVTANAIPVSAATTAVKVS